MRGRHRRSRFVFDGACSSCCLAPVSGSTCNRDHWRFWLHNLACGPSPLLRTVAAWTPCRQRWRAAKTVAPDYQRCAQRWCMRLVGCCAGSSPQTAGRMCEAVHAHCVARIMPATPVVLWASRGSYQLGRAAVCRSWRALLAACRWRKSKLSCCRRRGTSSSPGGWADGKGRHGRRHEHDTSH